MQQNELQVFINFILQNQRALRSRVCRLEALETLRAAGREPRLPMEFRSQFSEDALLWELFRDQLDGFFVEVGAHDGLHFSVSYAFEAIGWNGVLVEALPEAAGQCMKNRPHSRVVHAALSRRGSSGTTTFNVVQGGEGEQLSYHTTGTDHLQRLAEQGATATPTTVPLSTMNDVLADHQGIIDFVSIDVEGGELALLNGFDLHRFKPRVLLIEENQPSSQSPLTALMDQHGYAFTGRHWINNLYVRRDDPEMIRRASGLSS